MPTTRQDADESMMQQSQNGVREASARLHTSARPAAPSPNDRGRLADFAEELSAISDGLKCKAEALTVREAKLASREAKLASDTAGRQLFAAEESQQAVHTLHARWSHLVHRLPRPPVEVAQARRQGRAELVPDLRRPRAELQARGVDNSS